MRLAHLLILLGVISLFVSAQDKVETQEEAEAIKQTEDEQEDENLSEEQRNERAQKMSENARIEAEERQALMKEWEDLMNDFVPDEMLTFDLKKGQKEEFLEEITDSTKIRGAFFVSYVSQEPISFKILSPSGTQIYAKEQKREGIFSLSVTEKGQYKFVFDNIRAREDKQLTFALDVHNADSDKVKANDLDPLSKKLQEISIAISDVKQETKFTELREKSFFSKLEKTSMKVMIMSFFETISIILGTIWQTWYIKRILDNRRIV